MYMERNHSTVEVHGLDEKAPPVPPPHAAYVESGGSQQPVPMNQLLRNSPLQRATEEFLDEFPQQGGINSGKYRRFSVPECPMTLFYLPFPFCCAGCWLFKSAELTFDDDSRTLRANTWNGHCHLFGSGCVDSQLIEYEQIGNVGYRRTNLQTGNKYHPTFYYEIVLVLKGGQIVGSGRTELGVTSSKILVLVWHKFVFGRRDPAAYVTPVPESLYLNSFSTGMA